jgi:hypothetical protein
MMLASIRNVLVDEVVRNEAAEIETCFASGAWKAAYVLAGSALEQILVAHFRRPTGSVPAAAWVNRGDLMAACRHDRRLVKHEVEIAQILRGYRNMIRPHIAVRTERGATRSTAAHAMAVLQKISSTLAANGAQLKQPRTAEEIVMIAVQPDITDLKLHQLIVVAVPNEVQRLLLVVIPAQTSALTLHADSTSADGLVRLRNCFDLAFCFADEDIKHAVVEAFLAALDEPGAQGLVIQSALFRPKYLLYFDSAGQKRMFRHLLTRLQNEMSLPALLLVDGLEEFLFDDDDLLVWLKAVVIACLAAPAETANATRDYARRVYGELGPEQQRIIAEKQAAVIGDCEREGNHGLGYLLRTLQENWNNSSAYSAKIRVP